MRCSRSCPACSGWSSIGSEVTNATLDSLAGLKLRELVLENTEITDEGLAKLAGLATLKSLNLRRSSYLTDAGLEHLTKLPQVEQLHLLYNNFGDAGMEHLAKIPKLRVLDLRGCVLVTDEGLEHLAKLTNLERLKLRNPNVSDEGCTPSAGCRSSRAWGSKIRKSPTTGWPTWRA